MNPEEKWRCLRCGEENPPQATLCWACYTPRNEKSQGRVDTEARRRRRDKIQGWIFQILFFGGGAAFVASGYIVPKRRQLLGVGTLAATALGVWMNWDKIQTKRQQAEVARHPSVEPFVRIANTILRCGANDGATQMRLKAGTIGVLLQSEIEGEWRDEIQMPSSMWNDLRGHLWSVTRNWKEPIQFRIGAQGSRFSARMERAYPYETLILTREEAVFSPEELAQLDELEQ